MQDEFLLVMTSCPTSELATKIAQVLVGSKLAACIQVSAPVTSIYEWQGEICEETEFNLQIKCLALNYSEIETQIKQLHPYEVPEIIAVPISHGLPDYLKWIHDVSKR
ncbi:divalent-cation tolerance protein CutA [Shewanella woodyi]|uniref:CutA1 divalent ion tolerance protein n=1 Tax=Shewanella woodyi (strain ATCC 51908 / MS32) TaxID=392500 RepID=B1KHT5_SHEWM|nr:divalent-cation tolerance protein CutA [Shewanella woodyi]ACA88413.1 CutA1 divalent ion tolerance protein [Shewanella woodyi ATCC 51908]